MAAAPPKPRGLSELARVSSRKKVNNKPLSESCSRYFIPVHKYFSVIMSLVYIDIFHGHLLSLIWDRPVQYSTKGA